MKTKKYHTRRETLMAKEPISYNPNHPQIRRFVERWGNDYLTFQNESNLCPYHRKCGQDYDERRCLNNYKKCIIYQRTKELPNNLQWKPNPSFESPMSWHCDGKPLRETDNLEDMFIGSKIWI